MSDFLTFSKTFGLTEAAKDKAWRRMQDAGVTPDDPINFVVVAGVALESQTDELRGEAELIVTSIQSAPAVIHEAAKRAVGLVAKAAAAKAGADLSAMATQIAGEVGDKIAAEAADSILRIEKAQTKGLRLKVGAGLAAAFVLCALVFFGMGAGYGGRRAVQFDASWQSLGTRGDAGTWAALMAVNPDVAASLRGSCASGMSGLITQGGSRACRLPLWLDAPPAPASTSSLSAAWVAVDWLGQYSPLALLGIGLLGGLLLRRAAKLVGGLGPVAWLLDL
jgi:hypothetical protein